MQAENKIAENYAAALMQTADSPKASEKFHEELRHFEQSWEESLELRESLTSPRLGSVRRQALFEEVLKKMGISAEVTNLLKIMLKNRRIHLVPQVAKQVELKLDRLMKRRIATVTSASELSKEEQDKLKDKLKSMTGDQVEITFTTDKDLVGGFVVQLGYDIYDCSIQAQLETLRNQVFAAKL